MDSEQIDQTIAVFEKEVNNWSEKLKEAMSSQDSIHVEEYCGYLKASRELLCYYIKLKQQR